jgi:hypothetical protein
MSDSRARRSRLFRATPRRDPDADTSFGSHAANDRQTHPEPHVGISRRYGSTATSTGILNQTRPNVGAARPEKHIDRHVGVALYAIEPSCQTLIRASHRQDYQG